MRPVADQKLDSWCLKEIRTPWHLWALDPCSCATNWDSQGPTNLMTFTVSPPFHHGSVAAAYALLLEELAKLIPVVNLPARSHWHTHKTKGRRPDTVRHAPLGVWHTLKTKTTLCTSTSQNLITLQLYDARYKWIKQKSAKSLSQSGKSTSFQSAQFLHSITQPRAKKIAR